MKRRLIAAAWITGATVPLFVATLFIVGCCVFPFHKTLHKLMPLCDMAAGIMRGTQAAGSHDQDATPSAPAREKQEPVRRLATEAPHVFRLSTLTATALVTAPTASSSYRSFITLGAIRCDRDVGLQILLDTFLI
ncbi:MAG TPA: hypothetical protein VNM92_00500 [Thermoanaerobaculia bacterium]|nr:hypothetical protein [Thermoanaerobaculia bacterium]